MTLDVAKLVEYFPRAQETTWTRYGGACNLSSRPED